MRTPDPTSIPSDDYLEITAERAFDETADTVVTFHCPGCGGDYLLLPDDIQPPASHAEAWEPYGGHCRGNSSWWWCNGPSDRKGDGCLTLPGKMAVFFFPDRRVVSAPVDVERRRAPSLPPPFPPRSPRAR